MALIVDRHSDGYKHFCKICKKGFMCGRALGGHMRAHGISDYSPLDDDDDPASDWDDHRPSHVAGGDDAAGGTRRMYALRTNPNRLKSCRACENCGKEFSSWKSFLEHGKCGASEDLDESMISSHGCSDEEEEDYYDDEGDDDGRRGCRWSKRKRSLRVQVDKFNSLCPSSEEEDLANCLMMLSNGMVDNPLMAEQEESCASASRDDDRRRQPISFVAPLAYRFPTTVDKAKGVASSNNKGGLFECKACKKVFNSHQALGGHRASHKKVKGCFAARIDHSYDYSHDDDALTNDEFFPTKSMSTAPLDLGPSSTIPSSSKRKSKVHECSICHRVFSSGQALGGHKRCHWITSNGAAEVPSLAKLSSFQEHLEKIQQQQRPSFVNVDDPLTLKLDLNLPAPPTDARHFDKVVATEMYLRSWLGLETKEIREHSDPPQGNDFDLKDKNDKTEVANECIPPMAANNEESNNNVPINGADDEADSKVKLAKLSELNDMKTGGNSSAWLQVGIGTTAAEEAAAASAAK
ncbi:hypothetical protein MLD38_023811 [Melastoma candidum]|uniref:Uncharacterized protein n=1 Tax=Melastoma candidum TaxID=119954 RepID=A0ACB9NTR0_9MYRT|nr:hypothetical protein MLD38_023811 [Melastoma candidum]